MSTAVIPARGGSKRIPKKNVREFVGKPVIRYSIEAARESRLFEEIIVSTDDEAIAELARDFGASTPFTRPSELSDDYVGTGDVLRHTARWLLERGETPQEICCIYATAPFLRASDLSRAYQMLLLRKDLEFVFSATRFSSAVQRGFYRNASGGIDLLFPEHETARSQDLPPVFHDAGQFYWGRFEAWLDRRPIFGPRSDFIELPKWRVQDIDTEGDWQMAELLYQTAEVDLPDWQAGDLLVETDRRQRRPPPREPFIASVQSSRRMPHNLVSVSRTQYDTPYGMMASLKS